MSAAKPPPPPPPPAKSALTTHNAQQLRYCRVPEPRTVERPPADTALVVTEVEKHVIRVDLGECCAKRTPLRDKDRDYILRLMQNPDVVVILRGLTGGLTPALWTWEYLLQRIGHIAWKKVRSFLRRRVSAKEHQDDSTQPSEGTRSLGKGEHDVAAVTEKGEDVKTTADKRKGDEDQWYWHENGWKTMTLRDYWEYLQRRRNGDEDALAEVLYWIDFPLSEFLPELAEDFRRSSPLDVFPGGEHCAQRWVTATARPFMGPNLYITPPGGRTWFHEDGNGTVDSGHQCLTGRNEVIMLRRIVDEATKLKVLHTLNGGCGDPAPPQSLPLRPPPPLLAAPPHPFNC